MKHKVIKDDITILRNNDTVANMLFWYMKKLKSNSRLNI
jgi:hypothetical protein